MGLYKGPLLRLILLLALLLGAMAQPTSVTMQAQPYLNISIGLKNNKYHRFVATFVAIVFAIFSGKGLPSSQICFLRDFKQARGGFFGGLKAVLFISVVLLVLMIEHKPNHCV